MCRSLPTSLALLIVGWSAATICAAQVDHGPQPAGATTTFTQTAPDDAEPSKKSTLPQVTIQSRKALEDEVHTFVGKLTHSSRFSNESIPRWTQPLCFMVAGLSRSKGAFVAGRVSQLAASVGARIQKKCSRQDVNFYVVFTPNPDITLKYLHYHPGLLFHRDASVQQIDGFLTPTRPEAVRAWHNASLQGQHGGLVMSGDDQPACGSFNGMVVNCDPGSSRISVAATESFNQTVVVVDSKQIEGFQLGALSDYIGLVGLVDIDPNTDIGNAPSILKLFSDPAEQRPDGLTEWDRAFLNALYHTDSRSSMQRSQIATSMVDDIAH